MEKRKGRGKFKKERPEFDQQIVDLARVTRVTKGGKQLSFRACVVIGNRNGKVGFGIKKGKDVQIAVEKAVNQAKKNMVNVPTVNGTIPHRVEAKYKAGRVMMKPAPVGSGIIAGSSVRMALELAGVQNVSAKIMGKTNNKIVNLLAAFKAFGLFKPIRNRKRVEMENKKIIDADNVVVDITKDKKDVKKKKDAENPKIEELIK